MRKLLLSVVLFLLFTACSDKNEKPEHNSKISYKTEIIKQNNDSLNYQINIIYPQITSANSEETQHKVNTFINKSVSKNIDVFKEGLLSEKDLIDYPNEMTNEFVNEDSLFVLNNKIFSFYLEYYYYFIGAANGNTYFETYNFNLKTGNLIDLDYLFYEDSDYMESVSKICSNEIMRSINDKSDKNWINEGTAPKRSNFENFIITENGLLFIFEAYQVTAYASGPQYVLIPYEKLDGIINPNRLIEIGIDYNSTL